MNSHRGVWEHLPVIMERLMHLNEEDEVKKIELSLVIHEKGILIFPQID